MVQEVTPASVEQTAKQTNTRFIALAGKTMLSSKAAQMLLILAAAPRTCPVRVTAARYG
jgi:hypothetical protein